MTSEASKDRYGSGIASGCLVAIFLVVAGAVTTLNCLYLEGAKQSHRRIEAMARQNTIMLRLTALKAGVTREEIRKALRPPQDEP
jgi:hypothetical protein